MAKKGKSKKSENWFSKSKRIVAMNPKTYKQSWELTINRIQAISVVFLLLLLIFAINYALFSYTPIGNMLSFYSSKNNKKEAKAAIERADRLEKQVVLQSKFIKNFQNVILGKTSLDSVYNVDTNNINISEFFKKIDTSISKPEQKLNLDIAKRKSALPQKNNINGSHLFLFDPVEGKISQKFDKINHPGVDLITKKDAQIKACLGGIVLNTTFDVKDGYTIILIHKNGLISIYKHAQSVAVKQGEHVEVGELIGVVGNTGTRSTGPHLHFEFWSDMGPLNPSDYFSFGS